jgi:hypothetical protein
VNHLLRTAGWKVYDLGSNTPVEVFIKAIEEYKPTLICASAAYSIDEENQQGCAMLEKAAESYGAELLFFDLSAGDKATPELVTSGKARKILFSLNEFVPHTTQPFSEIDAHKRDGTRLTTSDAVESIDAPNE